MKKILVILFIALSSCATTNKAYDYKPEGKPGVTYKKAHKYEHDLFRLFILSFAIGWFIEVNYVYKPK